MPPTRDDNPFVSRAGLKLAAALDTFSLDVTDFTCADFGTNVGGFTDCLLQRHAAHVYAIDTGYGTLAYPLRINSRVTVLERTNALHLTPQQSPVDLVTIDLAWTPQHLAVPAALAWQPRYIISLIKPHYEQSHLDRAHTTTILTEEQADAVLHHVLDTLPDFGVRAINHIRSPIRGGKSRKKSANVEYLALLQPT